MPKNRNEAEVDLEKIDQTSHVNNKIVQTSKNINGNLQTSHVCNRTNINAAHLQSNEINQVQHVCNSITKQTPQICNNTPNDLHKYNLHKHRTLDCKECNYRCVECKTIVNFPFLTNSSTKDQPLSNFNKRYFNSNTLFLNQFNSDLLNKCKNCTVSNSSIPHRQSQSSTPLIIYHKPFWGVSLRNRSGR